MKGMKYILLPLSWIYGAITWFRNFLYNKGIFKSYKSSLATIVIGNLQVGGSGKTPLTAYLFSVLSPTYKTAILSRGYGRRTKGLITADNHSNSDQIGDEPMWYHQTLKDATVVVSERRKNGLQYLEETDIELVLLDDAFQHRAIKGDIEILLSDYSKPYFKDYPMPFGRLREYRTGDKRADYIIITKCPSGISLEEKIQFINNINPLDHQEIFFTSMLSDEVYCLKGNDDLDENNMHSIVSVSAIANPESFKKLCLEYSDNVRSINFKDHHPYSTFEVQNIVAKLQKNEIIMITEKDAVKWKNSAIFDLLPMNKVFVLTVKHHFLFNETEKFNTSIRSRLKAIQKNKSAASNSINH